MLTALGLWSVRVPPAPDVAELVRRAAGCASPACPCAAYPGALRVALGWPLHVDRAGAADLERLPGLGPARSAAIVAERDRAGPFGSLAALERRVAGIGPATRERLRPHLFAGADPACPDG